MSLKPAEVEQRLLAIYEQHKAQPIDNIDKFKKDLYNEIVQNLQHFYQEEFEKYFKIIITYDDYTRTMNVAPANLYTACRFFGINVPYCIIEGQNEFVDLDGNRVYMNDNGNWIYEPNKPIEIITFKGFILNENQNENNNRSIEGDS